MRKEGEKRELIYNFNVIFCVYRVIFSYVNIYLRFSLKSKDIPLYSHLGSLSHMLICFSELPLLKSRPET